MNHIQRRLIKEAYQEGYQEALHENRFLNRIKRFFGFDVKVDKPRLPVRVDKPTTPAEILNRIDDLDKQLDQVDDLDYKIPNMDELMRNKYIRPDGTIDTDKVRDALLDKKTLDKLMKDIERRKRLEDFALDLGLDPDDLNPNDFGDIG